MSSPEARRKNFGSGVAGLGRGFGRLLGRGKKSKLRLCTSTQATRTATIHISEPGGVLKTSLILTAAYILLLVVAGLRARSLALLSEAGHNLSDFFALLLSSFAVYVAERPPSSTRTYGYHRAGVLAALFNSASLVLVSLGIVYQAVQRFSHPVPARAELMMGVAAAGVVLNGGIAWVLIRSRRDLNIRSALIHEIGDTLSTAAVILGGWAIAVTGHQWIDPALSVSSPHS